MSTPAEAVKPQDAPVVTTSIPPDGQEPEVKTDVADQSPAAKKPSDSSDEEPETRGIQRRFDELTRLRRDAERDRDHWRELAMREKAQTPQQTESTAPKTLADFAFDEAKHHAYLLAEASKAAAAAAKAELKAEQEQRDRQQLTASYLAKAREFAKDKTDYKEVTEHAPISDGVAEIIIGIESGPEVAYYLGKNPDIAASISALPNRQAAFEIGQIAGRLEVARGKAASAKALVSSAPPPTPKIEAGASGGSAVKVDSPESDQLSDAEWTRRRNAQEQARLRKLRSG